MRYTLLLLLITCYVLLLPTPSYGENVETDEAAQKLIEAALTKNELTEDKFPKNVLIYLFKKRSLLIDLDEAMNNAALG